MQVVIIGAGLAGLSAAKKLHERNISFLLLEATHKVGGKVCSTIRSNGNYFELGPQFFNEDMSALTDLLRAAQINMVKSAIDEHSIEVDDLRMENVNPLINSFPPQLDIQLAKDVPLQQFYESTVQNQHDRDVLKSYFCEILNIHPSKASTIVTLENSNRYFSKNSDLMHQAGKPLEQLTNYLASLYKERIVFNQKVRAITKYKDGYHIDTGQDIFYGDFVIIATPPTVASQFTYCESLEKYFVPALQSYINGAVIKITWLFNQKFWRVKQPIHGVIYSSVPGVSVIDSSKLDEDARLTMFIGADFAHELACLTSELRLQKANALLAQHFGEQAYCYTDVQESVWVNDPFCGGGYSAKVKYGGLTNAPEILSTPYESVVFASSEIAKKFPNFMEGAIQAGYDAVDSLSFSSSLENNA